jgi:hypothetical protein
MSIGERFVSAKGTATGGFKWQRVCDFAPIRTIFDVLKGEFRQPCEGKAIAMDGAIEALRAG